MRVVGSGAATAGSSSLPQRLEGACLPSEELTSSGPVLAFFNTQGGSRTATRQPRKQVNLHPLLASAAAASVAAVDVSLFASKTVSPQLAWKPQLKRAAPTVSGTLPLFL